MVASFCLVLLCLNMVGALAPATAPVEQRPEDSRVPELQQERQADRVKYAVRSSRGIARANPFLVVKAAHKAVISHIRSLPVADVGEQLFLTGSVTTSETKIAIGFLFVQRTPSVVAFEVRGHGEPVELEVPQERRDNWQENAEITIVYGIRSILDREKVLASDEDAEEQLVAIRAVLDSGERTAWVYAMGPSNAVIPAEKEGAE